MRPEPELYIQGKKLNKTEKCLACRRLLGLNENFIRRSLYFGCRYCSYSRVYFPFASFSLLSSSASSSSLWLFICFWLSWMNLRVCWQLTYLGHCLLLKSRHINSFDYAVTAPVPCLPLSLSIPMNSFILSPLLLRRWRRRWGWWWWWWVCVSISLDKMDNRSHSMYIMPWTGLVWPSISVNEKRNFRLCWMVWAARRALTYMLCI